MKEKKKLKSPRKAIIKQQSKNNNKIFIREIIIKI